MFGMKHTDCEFILGACVVDNSHQFHYFLPASQFPNLSSFSNPLMENFLWLKADIEVTKSFQNFSYSATAFPEAMWEEG